MASTRLFRAAALEARRAEPIGAILLVPPLSFAALSAAAVAAAGAMAAFFYWGTYTAHSTLSGELLADPAVIKVYPPQPGIVAARHVQEGQALRKGDLLYVISSERRTRGGSVSGETVAAELEKRLRSLESERASVRALERTELEALGRAAAALRAEQADLAAMLAVQAERAEVAEEQAARYQALHAERYVSREQLLVRQQDAAEQRLRVRSFEREQRQIARALGERMAELESVPVRYGSRLAELDRAIAAVRQEQVENDTRRSVLLTAPAGGVATGVAADVGQAVDGTRPLVSIVPTGATLYAVLYAPSRAIGFVRPGDHVLLRYRAYPYQKFGHHRGTVRSVTRAALAPAELAAGSLGAVPHSEPLYRIEVALPAQAVETGASVLPLHAGMLIDADVLQETRRLYEWVIEPLYALRR